MNRRDFSLTLAGTAALAADLLPIAARAQGAPAEGRDYVRLDAPVPIGEPGRIEVIEFFWYGCPHCNQLEPYLEPWAAKLPKDVRLRRIHVGFNGLQKIHQQFFATLETMGVADRLHTHVFHRFHAERQPLNKVEDMMAWVATQGVDAQKFKSVWDSFSVQARMRQASALADQYDLDGVPTMAVQGRFKAEVRQPGAEAECLQVVDWLVDRARKGA